MVNSACLNRRQGDPGFALVISLLLMSFVLVLILSLVGLTRVEVQVARVSQKNVVARQNALLGLNLALAQLQRYAGPDQRITAPADLLAHQDRSGAATVAPSALELAPGTRYWTGVWGNGQQDIGYDLSPNSINGSGTSPTLLNWLVSGNEGTNYSLLGTKGGVSAGTGASAPSFVLGKGSSGFAQTTYTINDADGGSHAAALMVGANSTHSESDHVLAPIVAIEGAASADGGAYAWWVGDEGVKARVNLENGYQASGDSDDAIFSFLTAQRSAPELMDYDDAGGRIDSQFDFEATQLTSVVGLAEFPLLANSATAQTHLEQAASFRFHDMTTTSMGVLSDAYAGGLKKDLTADIADTSSDVSYRPADADPLFTPLSTTEANLPTWGHLRSWARRQPDASGAVTPVPATDTEAGFGPMLLYASLGMDAYVVQDVDLVTGDPSYTVHVAFYPVVVLSNPYPVAIAAKNYDLGFRILPPDTGAFTAGPIIHFETAPVETASVHVDDYDYHFTPVATFDLGTPQIRGGDAASGDSNWIAFRIEGQEIPAGESHIYRLDDSLHETSYSPGDVPSLTLAPEASGLPIGLANALILDTSYTLPASYVGDEFLRARARNVSVHGNNKLQVELVDPGKLGSGEGRYLYAEMLMGNGGIAGQRSRLFQADRDVLITLNDWPNFVDDNTGARSALRVSTRLEGRGSYSAVDAFGMSPIESFWLRSNNLRAPHILATELETNSAWGVADARDRVGTTIMGGLLVNDIDTSRDVALFPVNYGRWVNASGSMDVSQLSRLRYTTLFDVLSDSGRLLSLGQLQHAPFSRYSIYPSYPFANSYADPRISRTETYRSGIVPRPGTSDLDPAYDLSWHLNRSLWDRYFLSSVPTTMSRVTEGLPNHRIELYSSDGSLPELNAIKATPSQHDAYDQAASHLMVKGAFNINSTSEQAWRAVLAGSLGVPSHAAYAEEGDHVESIIPFPRISHRLARSDNAPFKDLSVTMYGNNATADDLRTTMYHGNRGLDLGFSSGSNTTASGVVDELARTIVKEIRRNGPFLSMADFVNRPILSSKEDAGIKGVLQTAIDTMDSDVAQANPFDTFNTLAGAVGGNDPTDEFPQWDAEHLFGGPDPADGNYGETYRQSTAMAPKSLTQADILSSLGPGLSARSDTFRIRAYGESHDPLTQEMDAKIWCEAIVQREAEYVDDSQSAWDAPAGANLTYGRRFKIISFRWLSPSEI